MTSRTHTSDGPRTSGRPRGADSAARREEILAAAAELLSEQGYRATSMTEVARACGLSPTGLAHYYPSKAALLHAVMERRDQADTARANQHGGHLPRGWGYLELLIHVARNNEASPGMVRLFTTVAGEAVDQDHPANPWLLDHHHNITSHIQRALQEAQEDGQLRQDAPIELISRSVVALMDGLQLQWLSDPAFEDMAAHVAMVIDALRRRWGSVTFRASPGALDR